MPRTGVVGLAAPQDYATMILADKPAGYWRLGEAAGVLADSSGNGTSLNPSGGLAYGVRGALPLDPNNALGFNGANAYLSIAAPTVLKITGELTVEAWIKTPNPESLGLPCILRCGTAVDEYYGLFVSLGTNKKLAFSWYDGSFHNISGLTDITTGWTYVAATRSATGQLTLYVNGRPDGGGPTTTPTIPPTTFAIGADGSNQWFNGAMDEVAVYPIALSAQRIAQHYQAGLVALRPAADYRALVLSDGPAGYWRLDDAGATAQDQVSGALGGLFGGITKGIAGALADGTGAMAFDGISGTRITLAPFPKLTGAAPWSMETWIYSPSNTGGWRVSMAMGQASRAATRDVSLAIDPTGKAQVTADGDPTIASVLLDLRVWHHLVGTFDGASVRGYLDGALFDTHAYAVSLNPQVAYIGQATDGTFPFNGSIDEAAIYPYALSPAQVLQHYQTGLRAA